jgi:hypothetical protein
MLSDSQFFLDRVRNGLVGGANLANLSKWIELNTRNPVNPSKHWSFVEHEFQKDIVNDTASDQVTQKCAQIGVSEIYVRLLLGMVSILPAATAIYTLPTSMMASKFAKQRLDTVIESSPVLHDRVDSNTNNASQKRIGNSFIYITGAWTKSSAISVPARIIINDEIDFSSPEILSSFDSRLGHQKEEDIVRRRFSTPTVPGYGVASLYQRSDQKIRAVKCDSCGTWETPNFLDHVVVPGLDRELISFCREDLDDERVKIADAFLKCPNCGQPFSQSNLADPSKREWVAKFPGVLRSGFLCQSFDLPTINTMARVLRSVENYSRVADWWNFRIGLAFEDSETSFTEEAVDQAFCLPTKAPAPNSASGTVIGVDVGKTSWITIAKPLAVTSSYVNMDVLHAERVQVTEAKDLTDRVKQLVEWYGALLVVVDAGPDWSLALSIKESLPAQKGYACYYVRKTKTPLSNVDVNADDQLVNVARTDLISMVAKSVNVGKIKYPKNCLEKLTIKSHLRAMKKVTLPDSKEGEHKEQWISTGPDHFAHSLFYSAVAAIISRKSFGVQAIPGIPMAYRAPSKVFEDCDFYTGRTGQVARYG